MKKIFFGIALLALVFFLAGCATQQQTAGTAFIGGTEALKTSFLDGNPPTTIYDDGTTPFAIVVKMENVGETDIKQNDGYIQINGLDARTYNINTFKKNFNMDINSAKRNTDGSVLNGQTVTLDFPELKYTSSIIGDLQQKVSADICYRYTNKVATQLCIIKDPNKVSDTKICQVDSETNPQNSGGPIHVSSLKENFMGTGKVGFSMVITHVGTGDNFFKDNKLDCNDVESNPDRGKIKIKFNPVKIGGRDVDVKCDALTEGSTHEGYVRLFKDSSGKETYTIYCSIDTTSADTIVQVPLQAEISYVYLQSIQKDITIRHVTK